MILMLVVLIVVGVGLALLRGRIDGTIYNLLIVLVIFGVILWILNALGVFSLPAGFNLGGK